MSVTKSAGVNVCCWIGSGLCGRLRAFRAWFGAVSSAQPDTPQLFLSGAKAQAERWLSQTSWPSETNRPSETIRLAKPSETYS